MLLFERNRFGGESRFFLDRWPTAIPLFMSDFMAAACHNVPAIKKLKMSATLTDRCRAITALDDKSFSVKEAATRFFAGPEQELPGHMPDCVRIFVARSRFIADGVLIFRPESVKKCAVCARQFFAADPKNASTGDEETDDDEPDDQDAYWAGCGAMMSSWAHDDPSIVCSTHCSLKIAAERSRLHGISKEELLQFDCRSEKEGRSRAPAALRIALKRNEIVARRHRADSKPPPADTMSEKNWKLIREMVVRMLNVDTALLIAATAIAESSAMARVHHTLPPLCSNWRKRPELWRHLMRSVRIRYDRLSRRVYGRDEDERLIVDANCRIAKRVREVAPLFFQ